MNVIGKFLINGTIGAAEATPIIGPFVITPTRLSLQAIASIAQASISLIGAFAAVITFGCLLLTISVKILSSTTSAIYHLFASSKKAL
jgi:hypothetical protein